MEQRGLDFSGETYEPKRDQARLTAQVRAVLTLMLDGRWRTLAQISEAVGAPEASVSARLRDLRKRRFGGYYVQRMFLRRGLFQYRIQVEKP